MENTTQELKYSPMTKEMFDVIIEQTISEQKSLRKICLENNLHVMSVFRWFEANHECREQYVRAKADQAESGVDLIHDTEREMFEALEKCDPKKANATIAAFSRVIEDKKWIASKLQAKKFGDRLEVKTQVIPDAVMVMSDEGKELFKLAAESKEIGKDGAKKA